jgi:hypothetical protein
MQKKINKIIEVDSQANQVMKDETKKKLIGKIFKNHELVRVNSKYLQLEI